MQITDPSTASNLCQSSAPLAVVPDPEVHSVTFQQIQHSPNLQPLLDKWEENPQAVVQALQQWLAWTHDLHMDLSGGSKDGQTSPHSIEQIPL